MYYILKLFLNLLLKKLIDPNKITKEIKELMKQIGATMPLNDQLVDYSSAVVNCKQTDKVFFVFLFSRKKTW